MTPSRRSFLKTSAVLGAGLSPLAVAPAVHAARRTAPRYRTALVGCGWWGGNIVREAIASGSCQIVGVADPDPNQIDAAFKAQPALAAFAPKRFSDFRELLDETKPEIVIVATPDHRHPLITIAAVKAGAHVYVEKPVAHTVMEGRAMVKAARDAGKMVQVGTHRRVSPHNVSGMEFLKSGKAGKIAMVRAFVHYGGNGPEQPQPNEEPPKGVDWNLWCGPAPERPFNSRIHPKGFRNFLDYANGTLGDWGIHWLDQILWWTEQKGPKSIYSTGGRPIAGPPVNDGKAQTTDAPDHQIAAYKFEEFDVSWEHRKFAGNNAEKTHQGQAVGCYFYGTEGTFHMGWLDGWTFYPSNAKKAPIHVDAQLNEPDQQNIKELFADFLKSIETGEKPVCDIEIGHRSTTMALLGMLSLKLGRSIDWDPATETIASDPEATKLLTRAYRSPWTYPDFA
jgi:predicted dehydrogenase